MSPFFSTGRLREFLRAQAPTVRNVLICFGVFWIALSAAVPLGVAFGKLNRGIIYGDSILAAIAMGAMTSMGRTVSAILAGIVISLIAQGQKPQRWAFLVAALFVIDAPVRHHWLLPPSAWDRIWEGADLVLPALACVTSAMVIRSPRGVIRDRIHRALHSGLVKGIQNRTGMLCVVLAFIPNVVAALYIAAGASLSTGQALGTIYFPAFLWLGVTWIHYRRKKTKGAAWLFALFPIAFAEPVLFACLWISVRTAGAIGR